MTHRWSKCLLRFQAGDLVPTLARIAAVGFLLDHFGGEALSGDLGRTTLRVLSFGLVTGLPPLWIATRYKSEKEA